MNVNHSRPSVS